MIRLLGWPFSLVLAARRQISPGQLARSIASEWLDKEQQHK